MMNAHRITRTLGTAAGALLAAGLVPVATSAVARADDDGSLGTDTDFMTGPSLSFEPLFANISFADPDDSEFVATVFLGPEVNGTLLFGDVLTSGADPSDKSSSPNFLLQALDQGVAGEIVNRLIVPSDPALDSTFSLPFTDPLAQLFTLLLPLGL